MVTKKQQKAWVRANFQFLIDGLFFELADQKEKNEMAEGYEFTFEQFKQIARREPILAEWIEDFDEQVQFEIFEKTFTKNINFKLKKRSNFKHLFGVEANRIRFERERPMLIGPPSQGFY